MRLRIITENINRRDFFDFYALLDAYYDRTSQNHDEIVSELRFITNHILKDHLNQFGDMLIGRLADTSNENTLAILNTSGLSIDNYQIVGVDKLSLVDKARIITEILNLNHKHGFTGKTWFGLGRTFLNLVKTPNDLSRQILAVDKIYGLLHHGGMITDYMDERDWLEDALNFRDNATPAQIFAKASSRVRSVIGRATHANQSSVPVSDLAKLWTALHRISRRYPGTSISRKGNHLIVTVKCATLTIDDAMRFPAWNGQVPNRFEPLRDRITVGELKTASVTVTEVADVLILSGGNKELQVKKPINRQLQLATDIIMSASHIALGGGLNQGSGISSIKPSYYYKDGRRVKL